MKKQIISLFLGMVVSASAFAVDTGKAAPDFSLPASDGKTVKLADYKGKTVVLEWLNHGCPFVRKHYGSGNMQKLQKDSTDKGIVWLSVISSAKGTQGYGDAAKTEADRKEHGSNATAVLIDENGKVGQLYGAKTTPHMYVIDPTGKLVYQGAIDDKATADKADIAGAKNYVKDALDATLAKKPVPLAQTKSYGCGVKYN